MSAKVFLDVGDLGRAIRALAQRFEVFAPLRAPTGTGPLLKMVDGSEDIVLEPVRPSLPLKALFTPPCEEVFHFSTRNGTLEVTPVEPMTRDRLVIGALGCDIASLGILDRVMLGEPVDGAYEQRRNRTTLLALSCSGAGPECFCASLGIDPVRPCGADGLMTPVSGGWILEPVTEKGAEVVSIIGGLTGRPTARQTKEASAFTSTSRSDLDLATKEGEWEEMWDLQVWEDAAARCIGCGICTVMCPTCHCFDVHDDARGSEGSRVRSWDSCMSKGFTTMAHGENPRPTHPARVRQRYLHKLVYFPTNHGVIACVGCGRCAVACPNRTGLDEIAARMTEEGGADE